MNETVFFPKQSATALTQTKRSLTDDVKSGKAVLTLKTETQEDISRSNTELLGALKYWFSYTSYLIENNKSNVIDYPKTTHYQLGTTERPIPLSHAKEHIIGEFNDLGKDKDTQWESFRQETSAMIYNARKYWLQTFSGNYILDEPIRVVWVIDNETATPKEFQALVTRQANGEYKAGEKQPKLGFILYAFKPLFKGHFNGWQKEGAIQGGFIKHPKCLYAMAKYFIAHYLPEGDFRNFNAVEIVQLFYYLSLHCNFKGEKMKVDMIDMLKHVCPSALNIDDTIRYNRIKGVLSAITLLSKITQVYENNCDFMFKGIVLDNFDVSFAFKQIYSDTWEKHLVMESPEYKNFKEQMLTDGNALTYAVKHHLKTNKNTLELVYKPTKDTETDRIIEAVQQVLEDKKKGKKARRQRDSNPITTPVKGYERTNEIIAFKKAHPNMSNRAIAEIFKCNEITIRRALNKKQ